MQKWPEVIGIGASVYDTLIVVPHYPVEDTKLEGLETKVQGGGPCATALVAAQKLGVSTAYIGTVGDDPFGRFLMADLKNGAWTSDMCSAFLIAPAFIPWCCSIGRPIAEPASGAVAAFHSSLVTILKRSSSGMPRYCIWMVICWRRPWQLHNNAASMAYT